VLALGNDFEFWAIKAAREWPVGILLSATSFKKNFFDRCRSS
jgi:hypothetical protein